MSYPPMSEPPKKGMSTGAKISLGCGGCLGASGLVLVLVLVVGALGSTAGSDPEVSVQVSESEHQTPTAEVGEAEAEPVEEDAELGQSFDVSDFTLTVEEVTTSSDPIAGNSFSDPVAAEGQWVIVQYTVTNNGSSPDFWWGDFEVRNDQGNLYGSNSDAALNLAWANDSEVLPELNPGASNTEWGAVDIPADSSPTHVEFSDLLGTPVVVALTD